MIEVKTGVTAARTLRLGPMAKKFPIHPKHPERNCWGCDRYCPADSLACGNGTVRGQHPAELFGDDWQDWELPSAEQSAPKRP